MPSKKLTPEQFESQKAGIAAELERRKANNNAGKQITAKGFLKREQKAALEIISKTNKGIPNPVPEGYVHPTKTELDNAWKIVNACREYEKSDSALKKAKIDLQRAEAEAKAAGYGDKSPEKVKEEFEQKGLTSVTGGKFSMDLDDEFEEYVEEDDDE